MSKKNNVEQRGSNNPLNSAYDNTVADYTSGSTPPGDNVIIDIACDASVFVGAVVRMNSSTVVNSIASSEANSQVIGICISKSSSTICSILTCGFTGNIYTGLSQISTYFLSDSVAGQITSSIPTTSGSYIIKIGKSQNDRNIILQLERIAKRS